MTDNYVGFLQNSILAGDKGTSTAHCGHRWLKLIKLSVLVHVCTYSEIQRYVVFLGEALRTPMPTNVDRAECTVPPCSEHTNCENCTENACMWCSSGPPHCVESNSYVASFPYGQCREWTTLRSKCPGSVLLLWIF